MSTWTKVMQGVLLWVLGCGVLSVVGEAEPGLGRAVSVHPVLFLAVAVGGLLWVVRSFTRQIGFTEVLIAFLVGGGLLWLSGSGALPMVENPCPQLDVGVQVNGECHGMSTQENWDRYGGGRWDK